MEEKEKKNTSIIILSNRIASPCSLLLPEIGRQIEIDDKSFYASIDFNNSCFDLFSRFDKLINGHVTINHHAFH